MTEQLPDSAEKKRFEELIDTLATEKQLSDSEQKELGECIQKIKEPEGDSDAFHNWLYQQIERTSADIFTLLPPGIIPPDEDLGATGSLTEDLDRPELWPFSGGDMSPEHEDDMRPNDPGTKPSNN